MNADQTDCGIVRYDRSQDGKPIRVGEEAEVLSDKLDWPLVTCPDCRKKMPDAKR